MARKILKVIGIIVIVVAFFFVGYKLFFSSNTVVNEQFVAIERNGVEVRVSLEDYKNYSEYFCANEYEFDCETIKEIDQKVVNDENVSDEEFDLYIEYGKSLDDYVFEQETK